MNEKTTFMGSMDYVYGKYGLRLWEVWTTFMGSMDYVYGKFVSPCFSKRLHLWEVFSLAVFAL